MPSNTQKSCVPRSHGTPPNLMLNRYRRLTEQPVETGISGWVIKARDKQVDFDVAIKRPSPLLPPAERRHNSEQLDREIQALFLVSRHPSACPLIDYGTWPDTKDRYMVTAWAEGSSLETTLHRLEVKGEILPLGLTITILTQVADLLAYAHHRGLVHNDVDAKHVFWTRSTGRVRVIDWANCTFDTDAEPIATCQDDLAQFGALMHRMLTGSTLEVAFKLGQGSADGWRSEMVRLKVPEVVQDILSQTLGRDTLNPYADARPLYGALAHYQQTQNQTMQDHVDTVKHLFADGKMASLEQAAALMVVIKSWLPDLASPLETTLHRILRQQTEQRALARAKPLLRQRQWAAAKAKIEATFTNDKQQTANLLGWPTSKVYPYYLLADILAETEPDTSAYDQRLTAMQIFLDAEQTDLNIVLDHLLFSRDTKLTNSHPLISFCLKQTKRHILRHQLVHYAQTLTERGQHSSQSDLAILDRLNDVISNLSPDEITHSLRDHKAVYQDLKQALQKTKSLVRPKTTYPSAQFEISLDQMRRSLLNQVANLVRLLTAADEATQNKADSGLDTAASPESAYQQAHRKFLAAFRLDPDNLSLYDLSQLMGDLYERQIAPSSTAWDEQFDTLMARYSSEAAQIYIKQAYQPFLAQLNHVLGLFALAQLDEAQIALHDLKQAHLDIPQTWLVLDHLLTGYQHLRQDDILPQARVEQAKSALVQAEEKQGRSHLPPLDTEMMRLGKLIEYYTVLATGHLRQVPALHEQWLSQKETLMETVTHHPLEQLEHTLTNLAHWQNLKQTILDHCLHHQYQAAQEAIEILSPPEREAIQAVSITWLSPLDVPDLAQWEYFCEQAQQTLTNWRAHQYAKAPVMAEHSLDHLPSDIEAIYRDTLINTWQEWVRDLSVLETALIESQTWLAEAVEADVYEKVAQNLQQARELETKHAAVLNNQTYLTEMAQDFLYFQQQIQAGQLEPLQDFLNQAKMQTDVPATPPVSGTPPLYEGYRRLITIIEQGLGLNGTLSIEAVQAALKLAPQSADLQARQAYLLWQESFLPKFITAVHQNTLDDLEPELGSVTTTSLNQALLALLRRVIQAYTALNQMAEQRQNLHSLHEAQQHHQAIQAMVITDLPKVLRQEVDTLRQLITLRRDIKNLANQPKTLSDLKADVCQLHREVGLSNHHFINRLKHDIETLQAWQEHRQILIRELGVENYAAALKILSDIDGLEQAALFCLAEPEQPDLEAWQTFCRLAQEGMTAWQGDDYAQAAILLPEAVQALRALLTLGPRLDPSVEQRLKVKLNDLAQKAQITQHALDQAQQILMNLTDIRVTAQIDSLLCQAQNQEHAPKTTLTEIRNRFARFVDAARQGALLPLDHLLQDAAQHQDPFKDAYQRIHDLLQVALESPEPTYKQLITAQGLAPDHPTLSTKIKAYQNREAIQKAFHLLTQNHLTEAWQALTYYQDAPRDALSVASTEIMSSYVAHATPTACLKAICEGYQALYAKTGPGRQPESLPAKRLKKAQAALLIAQNSYHPDQPALKSPFAWFSLKRQAKNQATEPAVVLMALLALHIRVYEKLGQNYHKPQQISLPRGRNPLEQAMLQQPLFHHLHGQLETLAAWWEARKQLMPLTQAHDYARAQEEIKIWQQGDQTIFHWLPKAVSPNWQTWQAFYQAMSQALSRLQTEASYHKFAAARQDIRTAETYLPQDLSEKLRTDLRKRLQHIAVDLDMLQKGLTACLEPSLGPKKIKRRLKQLKAIEDRYCEVTIDCHFMDEAYEQYKTFIQACKQGDKNTMRDILTKREAVDDPLLAVYQRF